jgi:hypothetical protein
MLQAGELLSIDVGAELRTLSEAQLQGSWQAAAELVRHAVQSGAAAVTVKIGRRGFSVQYAEAAIPASLLQSLAVAIDPDQPRDQRHSAIVNLEVGGAEPLLWSAGIANAALSISTRSERSLTSFRSRPGRSPYLEKAGQPEPCMATEVTVSGVRLEVRRAIDWTRYACSFAPIPVTVNDQPVEALFPTAMYQMRLRRPLTGYMGITATGDAPRLWLMRHGVLVTRAGVPGYPAFRAALEMSRLVAPRAAGAAMREAVSPHLSSVIDQAISMLIRLSPKLPGLPEVSRQRIASLLLHAAQLKLRHDEVFTVPLVKVLGAAGERRQPSWLSLNQLAALPAIASGTMFALAPEQKLRRYTIAAGPVAIVSTEERGFLGEILSLHFETPPRQRIWSLRWLVERLWPTVRRLLAGWWLWLRGLGHGRVLDPVELTSEEQVFLAGAQKGLVSEGSGGLEIAFCEGAGPVHLRGWQQRRLLLPRRNPAVTRSVRTTANDPEWLYPALLAVMSDSGTVVPKVRSRWVRKCLARCRLVTPADAAPPGHELGPSRSAAIELPQE